jgi:hypothetical protein
MEYPLLPVGRMTPVWVDFFIMTGILLLLAIGLLVWSVYFRKRGRKRRRRYRGRHDRRSANPTLAQTGGLPPVRHPEASDKPPPPTS